ncbi:MULTISPECIES: YdbC family protein [unclassified Mycoplasma]|uniref:YdbC family protein n=1 Tax=unclassified Mycoplasma TaxID=2683645 RepID=UPI00216AF912|nr:MULTISPECIES: PC4/YdbC family ssDNA-binding protein [unclassified Mycoplasma]MCS4536953.1 PC4/YdbC family ssDNA-binding protein [Mycoplasma sp. CSL7475-4]MCT4469483.1 PC4/YdbC family ssDNA-binding protein [Mycoplasma sp. HS2188]
MAFKKSQITNNIVRKIGKIGGLTSSGYTKELNLVSWNNGEPKYDIRDWSEDYARSSKGITLSVEELKTLKAILDEEVKNL